MARFAASLSSGVLRRPLKAAAVPPSSYRRSERMKRDGGNAGNGERGREAARQMGHTYTCTNTDAHTNTSQYEQQSIA